MIETIVLAMGSKMAQTNWEMANSMESVQSVDDIYKYNRKQQQDILTAKPWEKELVISINY